MITCIHRGPSIEIVGAVPGDGYFNSWGTCN